MWEEIESKRTETTVSGLNVTATVMKLTPKDYWVSRADIFSAATNREKAFRDMPEESQDLIKDRVKNALEGMYDTIDEWLPSAFKEFSPGNKITIEIEMLVIDHDREIERRKKALSFRARDAIREIEQELERGDDLEADDCQE